MNITGVKGNENIVITDLSGRRVLNVSTSGKNKIDIATLTPGMYLIRVMDNGELLYSGKFIKE
ncbi:MAG: T9SS C-terminal target domain-containing protein [Bacteroidetes bacterium]|nr:MAG: T9SS C-terminal target domain-containing protein [Bacteroidota bacterium]